MSAGSNHGGRSPIMQHPAVVSAIWHHLMAEGYLPVQVQNQEGVSFVMCKE
jgi:hypothetical protein